MLHPNRSQATVYLHFETNGKEWRPPGLEPWEQVVSEGSLLQGSTVRGDSVMESTVRGDSATGEDYRRDSLLQRSIVRGDSITGEQCQRGLCYGGALSEGTL